MRVSEEDGLQLVVADVVSDLAEEVDNIADRILAAVEMTNRELFRRMASMAIGATEPPALAEFTPTWPALSEEWQYRKIISDASVGFFKYTGALGRSLSRKKAHTAFGKPRAIAQPGSLERDPRIGTVTYTDRRGRQQTRARILEGPGRGKFVRSADIYKLVPGRILIIPFPNLVTGGDDARIEDMVYKVGSQAWHKLQGPGRFGHPDRPLLTPFLRWWVKYRLRDAIERVL